MTEILIDDDGPVTEPADDSPDGPLGPEVVRFGAESPVAVKLVPVSSPELTAQVLPRVYQDIVEVLGDAVHPMRVHHLCSTLGLSTDKSRVEGLRPKLQRLVERGWLTEAEPGLFAAQSAARPAGSAPEYGPSAVSRRRAGVESGSRP